jgi:hypothetical protein
LLAGDDATLRQHLDPPQLSVAVPPPAPLSAPPVGPSWAAVAVVFGLTLTSLAALATTAVLYLKPLLQTMQRATEKSEKAAEEMEKAAKEMEKTALMFQEDIPLTMRDIQRASEEWELVGKQFNFLVGTVVRRLLGGSLMVVYLFRHFCFNLYYIIYMLPRFFPFAVETA